MKATQFAVGLAAFLLLADAAFAQAVPLGAALGAPLGVSTVLGSALPIGSIGLLTVAAVGLVAGIRIARKKRSK